jgi:hypothetical protein
MTAAEIRPAPSVSAQALMFVAVSLAMLGNYQHRLHARDLIAGYLNDVNGASAEVPQGYSPMLWFFGLLSFAGFLFAALLRRRTA